MSQSKKHASYSSFITFSLNMSSNLIISPMVSLTNHHFYCWILLLFWFLIIVVQVMKICTGALFCPFISFYTLSEAWCGVNWADLMAAQGAFGTDFYDRSILRPKHRAYYCSGRPVIKIRPKGACPGQPWDPPNSLRSKPRTEYIKHRIVQVHDEPFYSLFCHFSYDPFYKTGRNGPLGPRVLCYTCWIIFHFHPCFIKRETMHQFVTCPLCAYLTA